MIEYAELYEKGIPPINGAALDQCHCFTEACKLIWQDQDYWKSKLGMKSLL